MSLKVLLVLPIREGNNFQVTPDCGILYLGTVLRNQGFDVTLLDCPKEAMTFREFGTFVREGNFDVVGFRCYSRDHNYVHHHLDIVKLVDPRILTLAGGPHPSSLPEYVLSVMPNLDFAFNAEAEEGTGPFLELFAEYGSGIPENELHSIPGLVWRSIAESRIVTNPPSFGIDLDSYGIPAWDLVAPDTYPGFIWDQYYPVLTTRGCPYPCTYCNTPGLSGRKLRHRSVEHVVEELRFLKRRYGIQRFSIIDDEFTLANKYAIAFSEALIDSGLDLKWDCPVGVRLDSLNPELLGVMEAAGCEAMAVGIESGSERIQGLIKKRVTVETIRERAHMIADCSSIRITGYFMIGLLDETAEEINQTIRLASELPLVRANFNVVIPIPGTAIFDELLEEGLLTLDEISWDTLTSDQVAFERRHVSGRELMKLQRKAYLRFYGRPGIIWDLLREAVRNREVLRASFNKLKMLSWRDQTYNFTPMYQRELAG
jgi:radical SAM superfamily enzyme YgiQ (UPF0313 family)